MERTITSSEGWPTKAFKEQCQIAADELSRAYPGKKLSVIMDFNRMGKAIMTLSVSGTDKKAIDG